MQIKQHHGQAVDFRQRVNNLTNAFITLLLLGAAPVLIILSNEDPQRCPTSNNTAAKLVEEFLTKEMYAEDRREFGLSGVDTKRLRFLDNHDDV